MRRPFALLIAILPLAACGSGGSAGGGNAGEAPLTVAGPASVDRPAGSFDRARYRIAGIRSCSDGMRSEGAAIPAAEVNRMCTCLVDRQLAASSDEMLRASLRDGGESRRALNEAARQCGLPIPTDADMGAANGAVPPGAGDPPPPEAPPPSLNAGLPPPVVGETPGR